MKFSIIITAWKEPESIAINIKNILNPESLNLSGELKDNTEIIVVCPDEQTYISAENIAKQFHFPNIRWIKDYANGKPAALNQGIDSCSSEVLIFMDGDVVIGKNSLSSLVSKLDDDIWLVSGRPVSSDKKDNLLGYWGNLLADAANLKRLNALKSDSAYFVSGYLYAAKKFDDMIFPEDTLVDDGWISLKVLSLGKKISYSSNSYVYVKYPKTLSDWFKQKRRSAGGYSQLDKMKISVPGNRPKRNFLEEIKYLFYPLFYAKSLKQLIYSLLLYPARFILWILINFDKISGKQTKKLWVRIESTK